MRKRKEARNNVYTAAVQPDNVVTEAPDDFVEPMFEGGRPALVPALDSRTRPERHDETDQFQKTLQDLKTPQSKGASDEF